MNASTPDTASKLIANQLAQAVAAPGGRKLVQLLRQVGLIDDGSEDAAPAARTPAGGPQRVGIWDRSPGTGPATFVRAADCEGEWHLWANVVRIEPKRAKRRIVFIGESVARGWGHPPPYQPARVLQRLLENVLGPGEIEVVDLARSDMALELRDHALAAQALEPDAVVIFSGNNWRPRLDTRLQEIEATVVSQGAGGLKTLSEARLAAAAAKVVDDIGSFYAERRIPVVWMIPEWNLLDWHDWKLNAPTLGADANGEWLESALAAEEALAKSDYPAAASLAERMMALDGGTASYGARVLAQCRIAEGRFDEARQLLEASRDARIWSSSYLTAPRPYSVAQNAIREGAARWDGRIVDLPKIFAEHLGGRIPDRQLFLDYCHLTFEGIQVAMSAAAATVAQVLTGNSLDRRSLLAEVPQAEGRVLADAALMAAIHNAHWWQPEEIVRHHCTQAVAFAPEIADMMKAYVDLQTSPAPVALSQAAADVASLQHQGTNAYILRNTVQMFDPFLLEGIASALESTDPAVRRDLVSRWLGRNDVAREPANLLSHYYLSASTQPQELAWAMPAEVDDRRFASTDYYRAYWIESHFPFVASDRSELRLRTTLRLPHLNQGRASVEVLVNGREVHRVEALRSWKSTQFDIPSSVLRDGVNSIVLRWPLLPSAAADSLEQAGHRLARGESDALYEVFGEVHSLSVIAVRR